MGYSRFNSFLFSLFNSCDAVYYLQLWARGKAGKSACGKKDGQRDKLKKPSMFIRSTDIAGRLRVEPPVPYNKAARAMDGNCLQQGAGVTFVFRPGLCARDKRHDSHAAGGDLQARLIRQCSCPLLK
jgi:hypothetical protein